jgi:hypothetical protein
MYECVRERGGGGRGMSPTQLSLSSLSLILPILLTATTQHLQQRVQVLFMICNLSFGEMFDSSCRRCSSAIRVFLQEMFLCHTLLHICMYIHKYMYINKERKRERKKSRERERERASDKRAGAKEREKERDRKRDRERDREREREYVSERAFKECPEERKRNYSSLGCIAY